MRNRIDAKVVFVTLWAVLLLARVAIAARLPLFVDEAFYWQEGRHLAWAYSDLPGLTAWLIRLGGELFGDGVLAVRSLFLLVSLALGTYVGAGLLVDGLRAPGGSAALIGWALLCIALGALADFALTSFSDSRRGRCRLIVRPRRGRRFAVRKLDPSLVDAMLHRLAAARQAPAETAPAA